MWKFRKNGRANPENVEGQIQKWLWEEGFQVRKVPDGYATFRYLASKDRLPKFSVGQPSRKPDSIVVESGFSFRGIDKASLAKVFDRTENLSWDLRLQLTSKGFFYKIQPPDPQSNNPGGIFLAKTIYYDGLSKDKLLDTTFQVLNTTIFVILTLQRHLTVSTSNLTEERNNLPYIK